MAAGAGAALVPRPIAWRSPVGVPGRGGSPGSCGRAVAGDPVQVALASATARGGPALTWLAVCQVDDAERSGGRWPTALSRGPRCSSWSRLALGEGGQGRGQAPGARTPDRATSAAGAVISIGGLTMVPVQIVWFGQSGPAFWLTAGCVARRSVFPTPPGAAPGRHKAGGSGPRPPGGDEHGAGDPGPGPAAWAASRWTACCGGTRGRGGSGTAGNSWLWWRTPSTAAGPGGGCGSPWPGRAARAGPPGPASWGSRCCRGWPAASPRIPGSAFIVAGYLLAILPNELGASSARPPGPALDVLTALIALAGLALLAGGLALLPALVRLMRASGRPRVRARPAGRPPRPRRREPGWPGSSAGRGRRRWRRWTPRRPTSACSWRPRWPSRPRSTGGPRWPPPWRGASISRRGSWRPREHWSAVALPAILIMVGANVVWYSAATSSVFWLTWGLMWFLWQGQRAIGEIRRGRSG